MINAGTRDEQEHEQGIAHFIEHAIFKGTKKRKAYHILNRLDSVGGEIDAYTTKETTCIYGSFLPEYYERTIDLISDIILNSQFPEKEIEKEKEVVLDEINVYLDSPSDQIYDDFEAQVFKNHALGNPILGTAESVKSFNKEAIMGFIRRNYTTSNMVFSSVGNISPNRFKNKLEKYFSGLDSAASNLNRVPFIPNGGIKVKLKKDTFQTHCIFGKAAYGANNPNRVGLILLNNILGGPAMNSILNLKIREKYGFTYNIESNYSIYTDCGLFSIYLASDPKFMEKCVNAVLKELKLLRNKKLSPAKLHSSKQQLKGQLAISRESNSNIMLSNAKNLLCYNRIDSLETIHRKIDAISADEILNIAAENLDPSFFDYLYFEGK
ncbi:MAG: insulinase family protein [Bacteroidetes bacterium]|nr:MAG: insulinase family protein [Bacteroidota bacterium]MBL1146043.1 insulinase family protein [Bacteroidota bacterium]NOG58837.1 insulinase family protein [Bacteroidota bacterium]